jgi:hypothetical protein
MQVLTSTAHSGLPPTRNQAALAIMNLCYYIYKDISILYMLILTLREFRPLYISVEAHFSRGCHICHYLHGGLSCHSKPPKICIDEFSYHIKRIKHRLLLKTAVRTWHTPFRVVRERSLSGASSITCCCGLGKLIKQNFI